MHACFVHPCISNPHACMAAMGHGFVRYKKLRPSATRDLEELESLDDDGLDHISLCHFRDKIVVDSLTEDNSHQSDIDQFESRQKPTACKLKTSELAKGKKTQNKNKKLSQQLLG